jgi:hypothetical protein
MPRQADPFPFTALRDLIGVARALYAAAQERGDGRMVLERIAAVGRHLGSAYELARKSAPGTEARSAAWRKAEEGTLWMGNLVAQTDEAKPLVDAAARRVRRR